MLWSQAETWKVNFEMYTFCRSIKTEFLQKTLGLGKLIYSFLFWSLFAYITLLPFHSTLLVTIMNIFCSKISLQFLFRI